MASRVSIATRNWESTQVAFKSCSCEAGELIMTIHPHSAALPQDLHDLLGALVVGPDQDELAIVKPLKRKTLENFGKNPRGTFPLLKSASLTCGGATPACTLNSPRGRLAVFQNDTTARSIDRDPKLGKHSIAKQTALAGEYLLRMDSNLNTL